MKSSLRGLLILNCIFIYCMTFINGNLSLEVIYDLFLSHATSHVPFCMYMTSMKKNCAIKLKSHGCNYCPFGKRHIIPSAVQLDIKSVIILQINKYMVRNDARISLLPVAF